MTSMAPSSSTSSTPPTLLHTCPRCAHCMPVPYSAAIFSQAMVCDNCSYTSSGLSNSTSASTTSSVAPDASPDALAALFSANMSLQHRPHLWQPPTPSSTAQQRPDDWWAAQTQHYRPQQPAPPPPSYEQTMQDASPVSTTSSQATQQPTPIVYASMHYTHSAHFVNRHTRQESAGETEPYMREGYGQETQVGGQPGLWQPGEGGEGRREGIEDDMDMGEG